MKCAVLTRRRWLGLRMALALLGASLGSVGLAQPVTVQSGEHDGFTRLVLDIGATRDWQLEKGDRQYRLMLDPPVADFAIGAVFDRIARRRLSDLVVADGLVLSLACDCDIAASRYQQRYLVLDIRTATPSQAPAFGDLGRSVPMTQAAVMATATLPMPRPAPTIDLEQAARIMAAQLARAAAQGLLQASEGRPMTDADPLPMVGPLADMTMPPPPASAVEITDLVMLSLPIRAATALDGVIPATITMTETGHEPGCTGSALNIYDWPAGAAFYEGLGGLRVALFDARDQLQPRAVLALARHYLSFGFGAEAGFWLAQIDSAPPMLFALAALVDDLPGPHFPPEDDPLACGDEELLWRYLDGAFDPTRLTSEEAGRLQRTTASLPGPLRDLIAPRIARALHRDGFENEARNLRDHLWRGGRLSAGGLLRLDRDLGLSVSDPQEMRTALATALRDAGGEGVAALAHAMHFDRETGALPDPQHIAVAEAMLREHEISPATVPLWHELVLAHGATGDHDRMLSLLSAAQVTDQDRDATLTALFAARLAAADTPALFLLAHSFGPVWRAEGSAAGRARLAAIGQLHALGLDTAAQALRAGQRMLILPPMTTEPAPDTALRLAWRDGNWQRIAADAHGAHRAVATRFLNAENVAAQGDMTQLANDLAGLSAQLADTRALRQTVGALLAAPAPIRAEAVP